MFNFKAECDELQSLDLNTSHVNVQCKTVANKIETKTIFKYISC